MKFGFKYFSTLTLAKLWLTTQVTVAQKAKLRSARAPTISSHNNDKNNGFNDHFDIERDLRGNPHNCTLVLALTDYAPGLDSTTEAACQLGNGKVYRLDWSQAFVEEVTKSGKLKSGVSVLALTAPGVRVKHAEAQIIVPQDPALIENTRQTTPDPQQPHNGGHRSLAVKGEKVVLAVRVIAAGATPGFTEDQISDEIFGTGSDVMNLKSHYAACSNGALTITPKTGEGYNKGVTTVSISNSALGSSSKDLENAVTSAVIAKHGSSPPPGVDYVMQCLPSGTYYPSGTSGEWIAYAYVNNYLSVYNNEWCNYPSAQMHELGHNIGLGHSNEGDTSYADQTGMMGYSYSEDEGPAMCFNAANNYQLGWYAAKYVDLSPTTLRSWSGRLVGLAQYGSITDPGDRVIVRFNGAGAGNNDYYYAFNRQIGINSGTQEAGDQVTVTRRPTGTEYAESVLLAKLSAGGENTQTTGLTLPLQINVNSIVTNVIPGYADVSICYGSCGPPPTMAPTAAECNCSTGNRRTCPTICSSTCVYTNKVCVKK